MKFKRILKYVFFVLFIVGLAFLYSFSKKRNEVRKVSEPIVFFKENKHQFLTHAMVNKLLIQNNDTAENLAKSVIDLYSLEYKILENPFVEEATVSLSVGGELKTTIKQRDPIARIISSDESYYVDKQGVKVPVSDNYSARVLLVSGINSSEKLEEMMPLLLKIEKDNFFKKEIIGIQKKDDDEYEFSMRSGAYKINFGKINQIDVKFKKLKAFYNRTFEDKTIQNYKMINLKYHNQVVCTK